jgi:molecular chaperone IbpA
MLLSQEDMAMRTYDFSPLFRSTVGFDRLARMLDSAHVEDAPTYPPYNIEQTGEDSYRVTMAVAGFGEDEVEITTQDNSLTVTGRQPKDETPRNFLYRGIAGRPFERRFELAEHVQVKSASLQNGLLHVELVREVPEAKKPRSIKVNGADKAQPTHVQATAIDSKAA